MQTYVTNIGFALGIVYCNSPLKWSPLYCHVYNEDITVIYEKDMTWHGRHTCHTDARRTAIIELPASAENDEDSLTNFLAPVFIQCRMQ